jgi:glycine cleavage system aminomethyltransferase T
VSTFALPAGPADPFDALLHRAGAVFAHRAGHAVAVNFGSPAGELAVCVSAVGLTDRSELTKLALDAPPAQLSPLVERLAGSPLAVGGAVYSGGAWWCGAAPDRVIVLCEAHRGGRMRERLLAQSRFHLSLAVSDLSEELAALALIGRSTTAVLGALAAFGPSGDPRRAAPFSSGAIAGVKVDWLLESDHSALALVARAHAGTAWRAIEEAGRRFGISCVGAEAASRYALLERSRPVATQRV